MSAPEVLPNPDFAPRSDAALEGGRLAAGRHLELVPTPTFEMPDFDENEVSVFNLLSHGQTLYQTAAHLGMARQDVIDCKVSVMAELDTNSLTAATHQLLRHSIIPAEVAPDEAILSGLLKPDRTMLKLWAAGYSEFQLTRHSSVSLPDLKEYQSGLLERLGAWSRPHAIRRGHELGLLS